MPHVVIQCEDSISKFFNLFRPLHEECGEWLIKIEEFYIECGDSRAILSAVVVEEGHTQSFYIRIAKNKHDHTITIRLDPLTDPVKTRGGKRSIALVGESMVKWAAKAQVLRTNVQDFLKGGKES